MDNKKLINWAELSRRLGFDRGLIRANKVPEKHKEMVNELIDLVDQWADKHLYK